MTRPHADDWLSAYLDGELSADERAAAERRLETDEDARRQLAELRALSGMMRQLLVDPLLTDPLATARNDGVPLVTERDLARAVLLGIEQPVPGSLAAQDHASAGPALLPQPVPPASSSSGPAVRRRRSRWREVWAAVVASGATAAAFMLVTLDAQRTDPRFGVAWQSPPANGVWLEEQMASADVALAASDQTVAVESMFGQRGGLSRGDDELLGRRTLLAKQQSPPAADARLDIKLADRPTVARSIPNGIRPSGAGSLTKPSLAGGGPAGAPRAESRQPEAVAGVSEEGPGRVTQFDTLAAGDAPAADAMQNLGALVALSNGDVSAVTPQQQFSNTAGPPSAVAAEMFPYAPSAIAEVALAQRNLAMSPEFNATESFNRSLPGVGGPASGSTAAPTDLTTTLPAESSVTLGSAASGRTSPIQGLAEPYAIRNMDEYHVGSLTPDGNSEIEQQLRAAMPQRLAPPAVQIGDVFQYLVGRDDELAVIALTVVDVEQVADRFQLVLNRYQVPSLPTLVALESPQSSSAQADQVDGLDRSATVRSRQGEQLSIARDGLNFSEKSANGPEPANPTGDASGNPAASNHRGARNRWDIVANNDRQPSTLKPADIKAESFKSDSNTLAERRKLKPTGEGADTDAAAQLADSLPAEDETVDQGLSRTMSRGPSAADHPPSTDFGSTGLVVFLVEANGADLEAALAEAARGQSFVSWRLPPPLSLADAAATRETLSQLKQQVTNNTVGELEQGTTQLTRELAESVVDRYLLAQGDSGGVAGSFEFSGNAAGFGRAAGDGAGLSAADPSALGLQSEDFVRGRAMKSLGVKRGSRPDVSQTADQPAASDSSVSDDPAVTQPSDAAASADPVAILSPTGSDATSAGEVGGSEQPVAATKDRGESVSPSFSNEVPGSAIFNQGNYVQRYSVPQLRDRVALSESTAPFDRADSSDDIAVGKPADAKAVATAEDSMEEVPAEIETDQPPSVADVTERLQSQPRVAGEPVISPTKPEHPANEPAMDAQKHQLPAHSQDQSGYRSSLAANRDGVSNSNGTVRVLVVIQPPDGQSQNGLMNSPTDSNLDSRSSPYWNDAVPQNRAASPRVATGQAGVPDADQDNGARGLRDPAQRASQEAQRSRRSNRNRLGYDGQSTDAGVPGAIPNDAYGLGNNTLRYGAQESAVRRLWSNSNSDQQLQNRPGSEPAAAGTVGGRAIPVPPAGPTSTAPGTPAASESP